MEMTPPGVIVVIDVTPTVYTGPEQNEQHGGRWSISGIKTLATMAKLTSRTNLPFVV